MMDDLSEALERAQSDPPPWRHTVDDFVVAGRRRARLRRARIAVGSSALTVLAAGGLLASPAVPGWLRLNGSRSPGIDVGAQPGVPSRSTGAASPSATATAPTRPADAAATPPWYSGPPRCQVPQLSEDFTTRPEWVAFVDSGYGYDDAVLLSRLWGHGTNAVEAKICMGGELMSGNALPIRPGQTAQTVNTGPALDAYTNNGYTVADAVTLAKLWNPPTGSDLNPIKVRAGRRILAGQALPLSH